MEHAARANTNLPTITPFKTAFALLSIVCVLALASALNPVARQLIRSKLVSNSRQVLSTVSADLRGDGSQMTVVKVRNGEAVQLEIYDHEKLTGRFEIPDARDGYFNFNGQSTNLAIDDIDGDGKLEVLAPTFDSNLVGQLNVYRYDSDTRSLKRVTAN